eukprot:bmy_11134T0
MSKAGTWKPTSQIIVLLPKEDLSKTDKKQKRKKQALAPPAACIRNDRPPPHIFLPPPPPFCIPQLSQILNPIAAG